MSVERYVAWCHRNHIPAINHGRWIELPHHQLAIAVTLTPPVSKPGTIAALLRITDPTLPVLLESFNTPHGELYESHNNGNSYIGLRTWVRDGHRMRLLQPVRPT